MSSEPESIESSQVETSLETTTTTPPCCSGSHGDGLTAQERMAVSLGRQLDSPEILANRAAAAKEEARKAQLKNISVAVGSFLFSVTLFFSQKQAVANPLTLLHAMESGSPSLVLALQSGKPTVIDFYADWCENCKAMAPTLSKIESEYKNRVNFVVIDGDSSKNADLVDAFRVDGIPHMAFVTSSGELRTALIGNVPQAVIEADLNALMANVALPYEGYNALPEGGRNVQGILENAAGEL